MCKEKSWGKMVEQVLLKNTLVFSSMCFYILPLCLPPAIVASKFALSLLTAVYAACFCLSFVWSQKREREGVGVSVLLEKPLPKKHIDAVQCINTQQCMWYNPHATYGKIRVTGALHYRNMISVIIFNWFRREGTVPSLLALAKLLFP